ncbi:MAG: hypothetical protein QF756_07285 [Dehalococcoidia bacterium]|nr:hypothetical protein [Dehalococcoidia bacterium]
MAMYSALNAPSAKPSPNSFPATDRISAPSHHSTNVVLPPDQPQYHRYVGVQKRRSGDEAARVMELDESPPAECFFDFDTRIDPDESDFQGRWGHAGDHHDEHVYGFIQRNRGDEDERGEN